MTNEELKNLFPPQMRIINTTEEVGKQLLQGKTVIDNDGEHVKMGDNDYVAVPDDTDKRLEALEKKVNERSAKLYQHSIQLKCNDGKADYFSLFAFTNAKAVISYTDLYGVKAVACVCKYGSSEATVEYISIDEEDEETLHVSAIATDYYVDITNSANIIIDTNEI